MVPTFHFAEALAAKDSLASRIAARRQYSARLRSHSGATAPVPAPATASPKHVNWAPGSSLVEVYRLPQAVSNPLSGSSELNRAAGRASPNKPLSTQKKPAAAASSRAAAPMPATPDKPDKVTEGLKALADTMLAKACAAEATACELALPDHFSAKFGQFLHRAAPDIKAIVTEMDRCGDGALQKVEFRQGVKKLNFHAETADIDSYFRELAGDGGSVPIKVVRLALRALQEQAAKAAAWVSTERGLADRYRTRADQARMVAESTETLQEAERKLERLKEAPAVGERFDALLQRRGVTLGNLMSKLDPRGCGTVSSKDLSAVLQTFGLHVSSGESQELFDELDANGDLSLDVNELKRGIKNLQECASSADADALQHAKTCALLRKATKMQHEALLKALTQDDEAGERSTKASVGAATGAEEMSLKWEALSPVPPSKMLPTEQATKRVPVARRIF